MSDKTSTALVNAGGMLPAEIAEKVLVQGDLSKLTAQERLSYVMAVCQATGLNPATRPFDYITLNNKLVLYAKKDATDQLRKIHRISITDLDAKTVGDVFVVKAVASDQNGRTDVATGIVGIKGLSGDALANALMKCETKAKRRVTLSICGLGMLDETEVETASVAGMTPVPMVREVVPAAADTSGLWTAINGHMKRLGIGSKQERLMVSEALLGVEIRDAASLPVDEVQALNRALSTFTDGGALSAHLDRLRAESSGHGVATTVDELDAALGDYMEAAR